jgi:hypothetical protein
MADLIPMLAAVAGQAGEEADEDFNQTVLLLHGDGTNGAQNNTFLDSSTNNFTITRNGNTTQGTFTPFSLPNGEWSNFFDGSGDNLTLPSGAAFQFGTGDFTVEGWVNFANASGAAFYLIDARNSSQTATWAFFRGDDNNLQWFNGSSVLMSSSFVATNSWNHIAYSRSGTTGRLFINGVQVATATDSTNYSTSPTISYIGSRFSAAEYINGYISNVRVVKGTAVYTSAFTPPTAPLTAITNTSLLTCQSNRFVDNSTNAFAITRNGDVRVTPFSPFAPSAAYDPAVNGGSGYFDGSGDYLSIADAAGLRFGTGNFTIQAWIYRSASGAVHSIAAKGGASTGWVILVPSDNKLRFVNTTTDINSTGTIPAGTWTHVAVVREGTGTNQTKLYINGVNDGQATVTTDFNQTEQLNIGADRGNANPMNGYIAGFKYVVGTAETITVPTAPPTGGTALLNFTNAGIFDNTGKNNLETVGDAQIDTGTKKYGTGSMEFDGTGDSLVSPSTPELSGFNSSNWTIEAWIYPVESKTMAIVNLVTATNANSGLNFGTNSSMQLKCDNGVTAGAAGGTISLNTWSHVAAVRSGSTITLYVNGSSVATTNQTPNATSFAYIGRVSSTSVPEVFNGFIDDLRITKGVARYTANFTAPIKAFPDL